MKILEGSPQAHEISVKPLKIEPVLDVELQNAHL